MIACGVLRDLALRGRCRCSGSEEPWRQAGEHSAVGSFAEFVPWHGDARAMHWWNERLASDDFAIRAGVAGSEQSIRERKADRRFGSIALERIEDGPVDEVRASPGVPEDRAISFVAAEVLVRAAAFGELWGRVACSLVVAGGRSDSASFRAMAAAPSGPATSARTDADTRASPMMPSSPALFFEVAKCTGISMVWVGVRARAGSFRVVVPPASHRILVGPRGAQPRLRTIFQGSARR